MSNVYNIGLRDIGIRKSEFVTKTQFLYTIFYSHNLEKNIEIENLF